MQLVLGGERGCRKDERGDEERESFHGYSLSDCRRLGDSLEATMMSAKVSSIKSVDIALTSGVTAILIIE